MECGFGRENVVAAILHHQRPHLLRNLLVPGNTHLLMVQTQFDLELLQTLLFAAEVVDVRIAQVISVAEERAAVAVDDALAQVIQLFVVVTHQGRVENMIVVAPAVKTHQPIPRQLVHFLGFRINHGDHRVARSVLFPADDKQIGIDLHVVEYQFTFAVVAFCGLLRLELHLAHQLQAVFGLVGAAGCEGDNTAAQVAYVVGDALFIELLQELEYKVHAGLGCAVVFFV